MAGEPPAGPASDQPGETPDGNADGATTPGGYSYTVVDDARTVTEPRVPARAGAGSPWLWVALALVPLLLIAVGAYIFLGEMGGGSDEDRLHGDVTNLINAFSQGGEAATSERYEGALPPGLPDGVPTYPGARVLSSVRQTTGADAAYLLVYDADASLEKVSAHFLEAFDTDPWQLEGGQDSRDTTVHSFSRIDDADQSGIVLLAESKDGKLTTIIVSLDVVSGADSVEEEAYAPGAGRSLPSGFPQTLPVYPDATIVETAYSKQGGARSYLVSFVTEDDARDVVTFLRDELESAGLSIEEGDPSESELVGADAIAFTDGDGTIVGDVFVGDFPADASFTQIDVRVRSEQ